MEIAEELTIEIFSLTFLKFENIHCHIYIQSIIHALGAIVFVKAAEIGMSEVAKKLDTSAPPPKHQQTADNTARLRDAEIYEEYGRKTFSARAHFRARLQNILPSTPHFDDF